MTANIFPFSAILGQEDMKLALTLNAINPRVGGVLIRGEKGTAKSTTVRAFRALLPQIQVVQGCAVGCDPADNHALCPECRARLNGGLDSVSVQVPLITLPLNTTEDMLAGGLNMEAAMQGGRRMFQPGLLARVHRGILYVDEVNLLDDHLVDIVLDVASSGVNIVEREGVSTWHPAEFILVGTMNPEEGSLRPHLLDRFGLCVQVNGEQDVERRVQVIERREQFDRDHGKFIAQFTEAQDALAKRIKDARKNIHSVVFPPRLATFVAEICLRNAVAGHRADLVIRQAALALAAYEGHWEVTAEDIERVAALALAHRRRDAVPDPPPPPPPMEPPPEPEHDPAEEQNEPEEQEQEQEQENESELEEPFEMELPPLPDEPDEDEQEDIFPVGNPFKVRRIRHRKDRIIRRGSGRRSRTRSMRKGRYIGSRISHDVQDIAFDATLLAAAPYQVYRDAPPGLQIAIRDVDLRERVRERRTGNFILFMVDASGSMGAQSRMIATKAAILSLLIDAYQKRDQVAMVSFRRRQAAVNLHPTSSVERAVRNLRELPIGGRTPLSHGLAEGFRILKMHLVKEPTAQPIALLLTDGKANVSINPDNSPHKEALHIAGKMADDTRIKYIVIDTEQSGTVSFGLASQLAFELGADYFKIDDLKAQDLIELSKKETFWNG